MPPPLGPDLHVNIKPSSFLHGFSVMEARSSGSQLEEIFGFIKPFIFRPFVLLSRIYYAYRYFCQCVYNIHESVKFSLFRFRYIPHFTFSFHVTCISIPGFISIQSLNSLIFAADTLDMRTWTLCFN